MTGSVQKVLDLQRQFEEARQSAIQELLGQQTQIGQQLKSLGYDGKAAPKRQPDPARVCPVCSQPGHDARRHKGEKKEDKKPEAPKK